MPGPRAPRVAEAATPTPPVTAAATSERMSPNMFSVTATSIRSGDETISIAKLSTSACRSSIVGYSGATACATAERSGGGDDLHREAVDERMPELDRWILGRNRLDDAAPETRGVEHVCLV